MGNGKEVNKIAGTLLSRPLVSPRPNLTQPNKAIWISVVHAVYKGNFSSTKIFA